MIYKVIKSANIFYSLVKNCLKLKKSLKQMITVENPF